MYLKSEILEKQIEAVHAGRERILQSMASLLRDLESEAKSELSALELFNLRLQQSGFSRGWYGAGSRSGNSDVFQGSVVVFDSPDEPDRINFSSARDLSPSCQTLWSGLAFLYASPLVRFEHDSQQYVTGADLAMTVYVGKNDRIRDFFKRRAALQRDLLEFIDMRDVMVASEVYGAYLSLAKKCGLSNIAVSQTTIDKGFGDTNIGHSLPAIRLDDQREDDDFHDRYSNERNFVGATDNRLIGSLWTLESRDAGRGCNIGVSFHDVFCGTHNHNKRRLRPYIMEVGDWLGMEWIRQA